VRRAGNATYVVEVRYNHVKPPPFSRRVARYVQTVPDTIQDGGGGVDDVFRSTPDGCPRQCRHISAEANERHQVNLRPCSGTTRRQRAVV